MTNPSPDRKPKLSALPSGVLPSLWVLVVSLAIFGGIFGLGFFTLQYQAVTSRFLPLLRVPWHVESVIHYDMEYVLNSDEFNDVIFLGASGLMAGLKTSDFEQQTGLRAYNLGNNIDIGPGGHLEMFRNYLQNHPKPRLLVYVAFPEDVQDNAPGDQELRDRFFRVYGTSPEPTVSSNSNGVRQYYQEGFWGIYQFLKGGLKHPYDTPRGFRPSHREVGPHIKQERGWQPHPQRKLKLDYWNQLDAFAVSELYDRSIRDTAELARQEGIHFMLYMLPVPEHENIIDDSTVIAWAGRLKADYPELEILGLPVGSYESSLWGNAFHLNESGAEVFTSDVSRDIGVFLLSEEYEKPVKTRQVKIQTIVSRFHSSIIGLAGWQ